MDNKIIKINSSDFKVYKNEIVNLHYENTKLHFPEKDVSFLLALNTINNLQNFLSKDEAIIFLALNKEVVVGFLWAYEKIYYDERRLSIRSLIVKENFRNNSLGSSFMKSLFNYASKNEIDAIDVTTTCFNLRGIKFYESNQFEVEKVQLVKKINKEYSND